MAVVDISLATTRQHKAFIFAVNQAAKRGHKLRDDWTRGRRYHTHCSQCGAFASVQIGSGKLEGSAFERECSK